MGCLKKDQIYEVLKEEILTGTIKPGEQLWETKLADRFKLSRTPVREALNLLQAEGLLQLLPKNGFLVKEISYKDILESFYIRIVLEREAAALAASRISVSEIEKLKELCIFRNPETIWALNKEFHMIIAKASGNFKLAEIIDRAIDEVRRVLMFDPNMNSLHEAEDHKRVVDALKKRQEGEAGKAMEQHLFNSRKRIHEQLLQG